MCLGVFLSVDAFSFFGVFPALDLGLFGLDFLVEDLGSVGDDEAERLVGVDGSDIVYS